VKGLDSQSDVELGRQHHSQVLERPRCEETGIYLGTYVRFYLQDGCSDGVACIGAEHDQDANGIHACQLCDGGDAGVEAHSGSRPTQQDYF